MKITHAGLYAAALVGNCEISTILEIEDACKKDLEESEVAYKTARLECNTAANDHDKHWADAKKARAEAAYLEKFAAYYDFFKGY